MAKVKSVLKVLPPAKVGKSVSMDGAVWESVDAVRDRIKSMNVQVAFDIQEIIEEAVKDAVAAANGELDRMKLKA